MSHIFQYEGPDEMLDRYAMPDDVDPIEMLNERTRDAKTWQSRSEAHRAMAAEWALRIQRRIAEDDAAEVCRRCMIAQEGENDE